jgi:hypothetical protein
VGGGVVGWLVEKAIQYLGLPWVTQEAHDLIWAKIKADEDTGVRIDRKLYEEAMHAMNSLQFHTNCGQNERDYQDRLESAAEELERTSADNAALQRQLAYLQELVDRKDGELSDVRKALMTRVGLLPHQQTMAPDANHKPIDKRRAAWDQKRAGLEEDSRKRAEHWEKKIAEVEASDKAKQAGTSASTESSEEIANDIAELARE